MPDPIRTHGPYCMICGGPAPSARHTITQSEGEIGKGQPQTTAELQRLARARVELELAQRRGDLQRAGELMYGVIPDIERQLKDLPHAD